MKRSSGITLAIVALLSASAADRAEAGLVTWEFTGEVTEVYDSQGAVEGIVDVDSPFSASLTFDAGTEDSYAEDPSYAQYLGAVVDFAGVVGDLAFMGPVVSSTTIIGDHTEPGRDTYELLVRGLATPLFGETLNVHLLLTDETAEMFANDSLPVSPPTFNGTSTFSLHSASESVYVRGNIRSVVPEPAVVTFLVAAIILMLVHRSRRRRNYASAAFFVLLSGGLETRSAFAHWTGGPVLIGGDDMDDPGHYNDGGEYYLREGFEFLAGHVGNGEKLAVCLGCEGDALGAFTDAFDESGLPGSGWTRTMVGAPSAIRAFFDNTGAVKIQDTGIVYLPSAVEVSGGLDQEELDAINENSLILKDFVKLADGGLFTHAITDLTGPPGGASGGGPYAWLAVLVPEIQAVAVGARDNLYLTCAATEWFFSDLTPQEIEDIEAATPWHVRFESVSGGDLGGLTILAREGEDATGDIIILGAPLPGAASDCNENGIPDDCEIEGEGGGRDCNENIVPDDCDVDDGTSCDIDNNGIPDECVACCMDSSCSDRVPASCVADGGDSLWGVTCEECSCAGTAFCCLGATCQQTSECACLGRGGRAVVGGGCTPNPCTTGVCCGAGSDCYETTLGTCNSGFEFQPLGTCDPSTCDELPSRFCPAGSFDPENDVIPKSGTKDARRPHPKNDNSFAAREGIGGPNSDPGAPEPIDGPERITIDLSMNGLGVECAGHGRCWKLCETGIEPVSDEYFQPLTDNRLRSITEDPPGTYKILLDRPISGGYWTTISYLGDATGGSVTQYASLPCDANNDDIAEALTTCTECDSICELDDVEFWVECCFQSDCPEPYEDPPFGDYSCNIDHGVPGNWGFLDLGYLIQMLQGRGTWYLWECWTLDEYSTCEGGGQQMMAGGEVLFSEDRAVDPVEWFVDFLFTATVPERHTEYDLRMVILILARFYGDELGENAKAALVWRLEDPSRTFATGWVADMVPEVVSLSDR